MAPWLTGNFDKWDGKFVAHGAMVVRWAHKWLGAAYFMKLTGNFDKLDVKFVAHGAMVVRWAHKWWSWMASLGAVLGVTTCGPMAPWWPAGHTSGGPGWRAWTLYRGSPLVGPWRHGGPLGTQVVVLDGEL